MKQAHTSERIGFIGQGFIGKNMADDFERRGYSIVRYALEAPYRDNKDAIRECSIVFIAIPTPTTPKGFDDRALRSVLPLIGKGNIAVIKSTILPGKTEEYQALFPDILVMHSPEFLREKSAAQDTSFPARNIVGIPKKTKRYTDAAKRVIAVLPEAPYNLICASKEAELVKYAGNCFLALKLVYMNTVYDLAQAAGANYEVVVDAMVHDDRIGTSHMKVIDSSGHRGAKKGRGAGGHCFPKDLAALRAFAQKHKVSGAKCLLSAEQENIRLLTGTGKDLDLLAGIYGDRITKQRT